jgi:uroporphyrin-3 C-methyltransferase
MTDKPASVKNSNNSQKDKKSANTITKSAEKSVDTSAKTSSTVPVTPPESTKKAEPKAEAKKAPSEPVKKSTHKPTTNKGSVNKTAPVEKTQKPMKQESSSKISKLAIFSLLIALLAVAGVVALYYWHMQQQEALEARLQNSANKSITQLQDQMKDVFNAQQDTLALQVENSVNDMEENTADRIEQLNQMVEKFSQNQPTDWLVHEAEYLVRVAARTLWLEKDATAAVGLLLDANDRITELNNPEVLPVRQLIHQDIATIKALPVLETEEVILSLIALGEQVQGLPLITLSVPQEDEHNKNFELSDDISQWRENIQKTWNRFLDTFVVVHSRMGDLEPILPADQRKNLKENLSLKLQIAQWAASKGKETLYVKSLNDVQAWLLQYFNMEDSKSTSFNETIDSLKDKQIDVDVSNKLVSLQAIRSILADRETTRTIPAIEEAIQETISEETSEIINDVTEETDIATTEKIVTPANSAIETAEDTVEEMVNEVQNKTEDATNTVTDNVEEVKEDAKSDASNLEEKVKAKVTELKEDA